MIYLLENFFVFLSSLVNISCYLTSRIIGNTFCKEQSYIIISSAKVQGLIGKSLRGVGILFQLAAYQIEETFLFVEPIKKLQIRIRFRENHHDLKSIIQSSQRMLKLDYINSKFLLGRILHSRRFKTFLVMNISYYFNRMVNTHTKDPNVSDGEREIFQYT